MTTPKPDGAGPTEEDIGKAARCWCDSRTSMIEMDSRLATVFAELLASERAEAEKRIAAYRKVVGGLLHQMKIINGDNEKCVVPGYCLNHLLINEAERLMKEGK